MEYTTVKFTYGEITDMKYAISEKITSLTKGQQKAIKNGNVQFMEFSNKELLALYTLKRKLVEASKDENFKFEE